MQQQNQIYNNNNNNKFVVDILFQLLGPKVILQTTYPIFFDTFQVGVRDSNLGRLH